MNRLIVCACAVALVIGLLARPAGAEDAQPWAAGVTQQQKDTAQRQLEQGNALFLEKKYPEALKKYEDAVAAWNHPAIRFNIVRCLIQLERPTEASDNLEAALKYGAAPLDESVYNEALAYQKLLANQIGNLEVSCDQPGAKVSLDGQPLIAACPGKQQQRVTPGQHQIVGIKDGYLTNTIEVAVVGGKHEAAQVKLVPLTKAARVTRRWATWKPWVVFGGGLALVGFGGVMQAVASSNMNAYDRQVTLSCAITGCSPSDPNAPDPHQKTNAQLENHVAIGMLSVGAAAAIAGGVFLYMNRAHTVYPASVERPQLEVAPTPGGAMLLLDGTF